MHNSHFSKPRPHPRLRDTRPDNRNSHWKCVKESRGGNDMRNNKYGTIVNLTACTLLNAASALQTPTGPIHPTAQTFPTRHKAFQALMRSKLNANTVDQVLRLRQRTLVEVDEDRDDLTEKHWANITHHIITQYGYMAALKIF